MCALSPLHGYSELCYLMRCAPRNIANKRRGSLNLGLFSGGGRGGERGSFNEGYLRLIYTWSPAHRARWERERERAREVGGNWGLMARRVVCGFMDMRCFSIDSSEKSIKSY